VVLLGEDRRGGVQEQSRVDHFAGVDRAAIDGAPEELPELKDTVTIVQEKAGEDLVRKAGKLGDEEVFRFSRTAEERPAGEPCGDQFFCRSD
jgi:hypothetical protein